MRIVARIAAALVSLSLFCAPARAGSLAQDAPVDRLLRAMPLEQRVGQMFMVSVQGSELPINGVRFIQQAAPGGVVLFENNVGPPAALARLTNALQEAAVSNGGPPLFIAIDQEGGLISRLKPEQGFTRFPVGQVVMASADPANAAAIGRAIAEELRAVGINMNLAPVADLETRRENAVVARRSFGSDPARVGAMVAAFIQGSQEAGVIAVAKHFPGHGETTQDSHTGLPVVEHGLDRLRAVELVPFQRAIDAGVGAIMAAHIWFPALEPVERRPASLSYPIVTGVLREDMGYGGLVITDALDMNAIDRRFFYGEAARLAVQAGVDLIAFGGQVSLEDQQNAITEVIEAVRSGEIDEARIDESARRILETKARFGLLDWSPVDPEAAAGAMHVEAHQALIVDVFRQGITLVKDDGAHLPLDPARTNLMVYMTWYGEIAADCRSRMPGLRLVGVPYMPSADNVARAVDAARWADTVVVLTNDAITVPEQAALVRALPPERTVVVAMRSPYDLISFPNVSGYVVVYTPILETFPAICDVLLGDYAPRGVLPVTISADYPAGSGLQGYVPRP